MIGNAKGLRGRFGVVFMAVLFVAVACLASAGASFACGHGGCGDKVVFQLTVLHNNDGESQLLSTGGDDAFGGVDHFATLVKKLRLQAALKKSAWGRRVWKGVITVTSGDNFLAGPEFNASLEKGVPFYDSIALDLIGYDAMCLGNHDFDFGPDTLADFIEGFRGRKVKFLSANLDFSNEPRLAALADRGRIASSTVVRQNGVKIGIVGATTEKLRFISSPRDVIINEVKPAVQAEIDRLERRGVKIIVLISHLQSIQEDLLLAPELTGVDIMVAGGGDELLANDDDLLIPGDEGAVYGPYPMKVTGGDGADIPVITTPGEYKYVGRLVAGFNRCGELVSIDEVKSGPVRVASGSQEDAVFANPLINWLVVQPVEEAVASLASNVIAASEVPLNGVRPDIRVQETNEGNLIADSLLWQAAQLAADFSVATPDVALQNGGGIRNASVIPAGDITELDTFSMLPFLNFVAIVPGVPRAQFKEIMENAVSRVEFVDGRFAQIAGFSMIWDPAGTAQVLDENGNVTTPGTRVKDITLDDGTKIVDNGVVIAGNDLNVATIDFLATSGDEYPYRGAAFTRLGVTYQRALANYIIDGLNGQITAAGYPVGGEGRIVELNAAP